MKNQLIERIKEVFSFSVQEARSLGAKKVSVTVDAGKLRKVASFIKNELGFDVLVSVGAIDYIDANIFQVIYYVWSSSKRILLMLRANIQRDKPSLPSLTKVWEAADYHERETWEMFGVAFQGHPNLTKLFLPEEWEEGFPLRKDFGYKLGSEE